MVGLAAEPELQREWLAELDQRIEMAEFEMPLAIESQQLPLIGRYDRRRPACRRSLDKNGGGVRQLFGRQLQPLDFVRRTPGRQPQPRRVLRSREGIGGE